MYQLHPTLAADTTYLGQLALCDVLLANNKTYPWVILVPRRAAVKEVYELSSNDQQTLMAENSLVAEKLAHFFQADKINLAAFGNQVPQLHWHIIVRYQTDPAWPNPIWLAMQPTSYGQEEKTTLVTSLQQLLGLSVI